MKQAIERATRLSIFEGAFYAVMVGFGETYFVANAVRLGATPIELALVVSLPLFLGACGPLLTLVALPWVASRRRWTVAMTLLQTASLIVIAWLDLHSRLDPKSLILCICFYQAGGLAAAVAWNSWFGDLVPSAGRGRYFARRSRVVQIILLSSVVIAGSILQVVEPTRAGAASASTIVSRGFLLLLLIAAAARLVSSILLLITFEPPFQRPATLRQVGRFTATSRGASAVRLLLCAASLQLMTYIASPFFVPFMLEELEFSYLEYMTATIAVMVGKFLFFPAWGRTIDHHGARSALMLAATMVALVPVPWLLNPGLVIVIAAQLLSGATWSGWEVSFFSILVEHSVKRTRAFVFAAQSVLNGAAQLIGSAIGALLLQSLDRRFVLVFAVSAILRLAVVALLPKLVPRGLDPGPGRRELILRAVGVRPSGGVAHRPVVAWDDEDKD